MTTLDTQLQAVSASVRAQAPQAVLTALDAAIERLNHSDLLSHSLAVGAAMPPFVLPDATGQHVRSTDLLADGPLVISFYRGAWCPYCNLELRAWQERLPELAALGGRFVAISPQTPDASLSLAQKHALAYPVLSDAGHAVARQFGLVYRLDDELRPIYAGFGIDLPAVNGDHSFELPVPATYLIDASGRVIGRWIDADYRHRAEPAEVLAQLRAAAAVTTGTA